MERERVPEEQRDRHLKLGPGGLADVEFLVQWIQRRDCARSPALRTGGRTRALRTADGRQRTAKT